MCADVLVAAGNSNASSKAAKAEAKAKARVEAQAAKAEARAAKEAERSAHKAKRKLTEQTEAQKILLQSRLDPLAPLAAVGAAAMAQAWTTSASGPAPSAGAVSAERPAR